MSDVTSVDVSEVLRMGGTVLDAAARLEGLATGIRDWQYAAHDAVEGASMCYSATSYAGGCWRSTLGDLAEAVRRLGGDLRQAAIDYREADAASAERVRRSGHPAFAPGGGADPLGGGAGPR